MHIFGLQQPSGKAMSVRPSQKCCVCYLHVRHMALQAVLKHSRKVAKKVDE